MHDVVVMAVRAAVRCWYQSGMEPGRKCRLNSVLELIGRSGSGKHIAVRLYKLLMKPIKLSDEAQTAALNRPAAHMAGLSPPAQSLHSRGR